jgi:hypothetical protein
MLNIFTQGRSLSTLSPQSKTRSTMSSPALDRCQNGFLNPSETSLGRLVLDTAHPQKNFCKASILDLKDEHRARREFSNIDNMIGAGSTSNLRLLLTKLLDTTERKTDTSTDALKTDMAVSYILYNVNDTLDDLLQEDKVMGWLKKNRTSSRIYMVVAIHTVQNAAIKLDAMEVAGAATKTAVPVAEAADLLIAPGASIIANAAGANAEISGSHQTNRQQSSSFVVPGERIIAVDYQELQFQPFSSTTADAPRLAKTAVRARFDNVKMGGPDMVDATIRYVSNFASNLKFKMDAEGNGSTGKLLSFRRAKPAAVAA